MLIRISHNHANLPLEKRGSRPDGRLPLIVLRIRWGNKKSRKLRYFLQISRLSINMVGVFIHNCPKAYQ